MGTSMNACVCWLPGLEVLSVAIRKYQLTCLNKGWHNAISNYLAKESSVNRDGKFVLGLKMETNEKNSAIIGVLSKYLSLIVLTITVI